MSNQNDIHETVSRAYTEALRKSQRGGGGCCSSALPSTPCCGAPPPEGVVAQSAGYGADAEQYGTAKASSFGCGNPLAFAGVQPGQTVLDLGSGAGLDLLIAADKVGPSGQVIGIDMTDAMIDTARQNIAKAGHANVEVRKGIIEELPVDTDSVDWVISNCVINLSPDKPRVFAEIHRVLRPGGKFSISDIVVEELPQWIRTSIEAYSACIAGAISESDYLAGLRAAGLADVKVTERLVYEADQIRGMVDSELGNLGIDPQVAAEGFKDVAGKVWSAKFLGHKG